MKFYRKVITNKFASKLIAKVIAIIIGSKYLLDIYSSQDVIKIGILDEAVYVNESIIYESKEFLRTFDSNRAFNDVAEELRCLRPEYDSLKIHKSSEEIMQELREKRDF